MENKRWTLSNYLNVLLFVGLAASLYYVYKCYSGPTPVDCDIKSTCNLEAPKDLQAELEESTLNISWSELNDVNYYLVDVYDVTEGVKPIINSFPIRETKVTFTAEQGIEKLRDYQVSIRGVCNDCTPSGNVAAMLAGIVIYEDILMMQVPCEDATCDCKENGDLIPIDPPGPGKLTTTPNPGEYILQMDSNLELFRFSAECGGQELVYFLQTEIATTGPHAGARIINAPSCSDLGDNCGGNCPASPNGSNTHILERLTPETHTHQIVESYMQIPGAGGDKIAKLNIQMGYMVIQLPPGLVCRFEVRECAGPDPDCPQPPSG